MGGKWDSVRKTHWRLRGRTVRLSGLGPQSSKKVLQESLAFCFEYSVLDQNLVIEPGFCGQIKYGTASTSFGITRAEHQAWNSGKNDGADAHGARFQGDIHGRIGQAPRAEHRCGSPDCNNFCVSSRILPEFTIIVRLCEKFAVPNDDGANRDLSYGGGFCGLPQTDLPPFPPSFLILGPPTPGPRT